MYLLDTQALTDLTSGSENKVRDRVRRATQHNQDVKASVVSFGLLKARILSIKDSAGRDVWEKRFEIARRTMRTAGDMLEVTEATAMEFAFVNNLHLFSYNREGLEIPLGDGDRLVLSTAISEGFTLLTTDVRGYREAVDIRNLLIEEI
ncbi:MAG: type II toxin-antitoxin system VapC family toxin [Rhizobiaceae bacterium]